MKHSLALIALLAAAPAFASDVDLVPYGYVSHVMRTAAAQASAAVAGSVAPTTRAQVAAEAREAARLGLVNHGEADHVSMTADQARRIEDAGRRADDIRASSH